MSVYTGVMVKFKARIWRSGSSGVLTVPAPLFGAEVEMDQEVLVELQPIIGTNAFSQILSGNHPLNPTKVCEVS